MHKMTLKMTGVFSYLWLTLLHLFQPVLTARFVTIEL